MDASSRKTVLITGTSSGIGRATAAHFAQRGWNVAATMRRPEATHPLASVPHTKLYALDVTSNDSIAAAIEAVNADFGGVDCLVNNAGYGVDGVFEAMSDEVIAKQLMNITLSADHRITDGAEAARFLGEVRRSLEQPLDLLVD